MIWLRIIIVSKGYTAGETGYFITIEVIPSNGEVDTVFFILEWMDIKDEVAVCYFCSSGNFGPGDEVYSICTFYIFVIGSLISYTLRKSLKLVAEGCILISCDVTL